MILTGKNSMPIVCLVCLFFICHSASAVTVRLQGGTNQCEGRLEIPSRSDFGSACDRNFGTEEAKVICRQLGCPSETSARVDANNFGPRTNNILQAFGRECSGTENSIEDCDLVGAFCSPRDTIGVMCTTVTAPPPQLVVMVGFDPTMYTVSEGGVVSFTIRRLTATTRTVSVIFNTVGNTAIAPGDYGAVLNRMVTFGPSDNTQTVDVMVNTDSIAEAAELFLGRLSLPSGSSGVAISGGDATATISDTNVVMVGFDPTMYTVSEGGIVSFIIRRLTTATRTVSVVFNTVGSTAMAPGDYSAVLNRIIVFGPSDDNQTVDVMVNTDSIAEVAETFLGRLSLPAGSSGVAISGGDATATIDEDELRLVGGANSCEGRLEVPSRSDFGSACDRNFGTEEAKVICRQLGCPSETSARVDANNFGPRTNNILQAFGRECSGTENSIEDCDLVGAFCSPSDTIGVMCTTVTAPPPQLAEGDLRLVGGASRCEGRLQVSVIDQRSTTNSLQWSTTCDRGFSTEEIRTACRQLGCPTGNPSRQSISRFGGRPPSPHVYQAFGFTCSGQENKVVYCPYTGAFCDIRNGRIADIIGMSCNDGDEPTAVATTQPPGSPAEGALRLAGGSNSCQGRLQVYIPFLGKWAQAVYRDFGSEEVQVACRELGCGDQGERISASSASGPYQEVGYRCNGDEEMLDDCQQVAAFGRSSQYYIGLRCGAACTQNFFSADTCASFSSFCHIPVVQELCCITCSS